MMAENRLAPHYAVAFFVAISSVLFIAAGAGLLTYPAADSSGDPYSMCPDECRSCQRSYANSVNTGVAGIVVPIIVCVIWAISFKKEGMQTRGFRFIFSCPYALALGIALTISSAGAKNYIPVADQCYYGEQGYNECFCDTLSSSYFSLSIAGLVLGVLPPFLCCVCDKAEDRSFSFNFLADGAPVIARRVPAPAVPSAVPAYNYGSGSNPFVSAVIVVQSNEGYNGSRYAT